METGVRPTDTYDISSLFLYPYAYRQCFHRGYLPLGKDKQCIMFSNMIGYFNLPGDLLDPCRSLVFSFLPNLWAIQPSFFGCHSWLWASLAEQGLYMSCANHCSISFFFPDARFGSEVATFQHWGPLKDACMFHLLCLLRVYLAYNGRLLQQTVHTALGLQVRNKAFLKINLLLWSGGAIGTERLPARIYNLESKGAKWAA